MCTYLFIGEEITIFEFIHRQGLKLCEQKTELIKPRRGLSYECVGAHHETIGILSRIPLMRSLGYYQWCLQILLRGSPCCTNWNITLSWQYNCPSVKPHFSLYMGIFWVEPSIQSTQTGNFEKSNSLQQHLYQKYHNLLYCLLCKIGVDQGLCFFIY